MCHQLCQRRNVWQQTNPKNPSQVEDPLAKAEDVGISEEDRREVLKSIENIASENRISLDDSEAFALKEAKSGVILPIMVNLLSVAVVAVVIFLLSQAFQNDTTTLVERGLEFSSLEGQLLRELQKESQNQISAKDREIGDYEERLTTLESQRQELSDSLGSRLEARQMQYDQELSDALAAERARLETQGLDGSEIDRLLAIQEEELRAFYSAQLLAYQEELIAEQQDVVNRIEGLRSEYSQQIDDLKTERTTLVEDFRTQEVSLRTELEQQSQVIEQSTETIDNLQAAREELAQLEAERENADAIEAQLIGLFERLQETLNRSDWSPGLETVRQIRNFLNERQVQSVTALAERRSTDLFVLSTIEQYIENIIQNEENFSSISAQLDVLSRIQVNNQRAINALENNNETLASTIYFETMSLMPELRTANDALIDDARNQLNEQLNEQFASELETRTENVAELVQTAEDAIEQGDYTFAITSFDRALQSLPEFENNAVSINSNLVGLGYTLADRVVLRENTQPFNTIFQRSQINTGVTLSAINEQINAAVRQREGELLTELSAADSEFAALQEQYEKTLNDLRANLSSSFDVQIDSLNDELAARETELVSIRTRSDEFEQLSNNLQAEVARLEDFEIKLSTIQNKYTDFKVNVDALRTLGSPDDFVVRGELEKFVGSSELDAIFPDFRNEIRLNYKPSEKAGREAGLSLAKDIVTGFSGQATLGQRRLYLETELEYAREDADEIMEAFLVDLLDAIN